MESHNSKNFNGGNQKLGGYWKTASVDRLLTLVSLTFIHWLPGKKQVKVAARLQLRAAWVAARLQLQITAVITWISQNFLRYLWICISSTLLHQATTVKILFEQVKRMVHSNSWTQVQTGQQGGEKEQSSLKQRLQGRGWLSWFAIRRSQ